MYEILLLKFCKLDLPNYSHNYIYIHISTCNWFLTQQVLQYDDNTVI